LHFIVVFILEEAAKQKAEADAKKKADDEAKKKAAAEAAAKQKAEAEAKKKAGRIICIHLLKKHYFQIRTIIYTKFKFQMRRQSERQLK
jgi:hypothetical protein